MPLTIKNDTVYVVKLPLDADSSWALKFFKSDKGTVMYVPFDPNTGQIPQTPLDSYIKRKVGSVLVVYSPNVHKVFQQFYLNYDPRKGQYYTAIPVLLVDYGTPVEAEYYGTNEPPGRDIAQQYRDWLAGFMYSRVKLPNAAHPNPEIQICTYYSGRYGCLKTKTVKMAHGYWWAKYEARLLNIPAGLTIAERDVIKFYYKRPNNVAFKIPGFSSIADYLMKRKLTGSGLNEIKAMLSAFGLAIDSSAQYQTDSGKTVTGVYAEDTSDGYVVYVPVIRVAGMAIQIPIVLIGLVVVAVTLIVSLHYIYKIEATRTARYKEYVNFVKDAQKQMTDCVSQCNQISDPKGREGCIKACSDAYADAVNSATDSFKKTMETNPFKEMTDMLKWAVFAMIAISLMRAMGEMMKK